MNIRTIRTKVRNFLKRRADDTLSRLPREIRRFGASGVMPVDPVARAYVALTTASLAAMDGSIGGDGHDAACRRFQEKYDSWQGTLKEVEP
jgi:hypothetical protein